MNLEQYKSEAARTFIALDSTDKDWLHLTSGLVTEFGEFVDIFKRNIAYGKEIDRVNLSEEWADYMWYMANLARTNNWNFSIDQPKVDNIKADMLSEKDDDTHDLAFIIGYNSTIGESLYFSNEEVFEALLVSWYGIAAFFEIDTEKALENNINKLKVRFPEKFTNEDALNRDLGAERAELEK